MNEEDNYIMIPELQQFVFCRKQWGIIHIESQWKDNYLTVEGNVEHKTSLPVWGEWIEIALWPGCLPG